MLEEETAIALMHRSARTFLVAAIALGAFTPFGSLVGLRAAPPQPPAGPPASVAFPLTLPSSLMVEHDVTITARVSGVVESIQADRGDLVRKGQPLATLDQREFDLDRRAADETLNVSLSDFKRTEELYRQSLASLAEMEKKKAQLELARVDAEKARLVIDRSVIRAPFDGVVVERFARVGEKYLVEEHKPLYRVMALAPLQARAFLPAAALSHVRAGDAVQVAASGSPETRTTGRVAFISPVIDPASATVQVVVHVDQDPRRFLRPGSAVLLTIGASAKR